MSLQRYTDNASTTLAANITSTATSLSVTSGTGSLFPTLTGSQWFVATLIKNGVPTTQEIIRVSARSGDNFTTIVRAQEGTTALAWNAGDTVALQPTSGGFLNFSQVDDTQAQTGNYAADVGTASAYSVTLTPALTAHLVGTPIRFLAAHSNTAGATFNDGAGAANLTYPSGATLVANTILAGGIYEVFWNGTSFQLLGYQSAGSWTATLSGPWATGSNPSGTLYYSVANNRATIYANSQITQSATSSTTILVTGLPAAAAPSSGRFVPCSGLYNLGNNVLGQANPFSSPSNEIVLSLYTSSSQGLLAGANFSSGGTAGILAGWSITYPLSP